MMDYALKHDGFIYIELCLAPAVPAQSGFVARTVADELLLRPVDLVGYLWQVCSAAIALTDIDAVPMQLKLVETLDASHRGKHRNLDVDIIEFLAAQWCESWVFEGGRPGHMGHNLMQGHILAEMSDAASELAMLMEGDEGSTLLF